MLDICACLITLLQDHPELTAHLMELGFPRKMKDNIDSLNPSSPAYELSLLVLCALLRSPSVLHRTAVLSLAVGTAGHNDTSVRASPFMVSSACSNNSASTSGGFHSQLQQQQQLQPQSHEFGNVSSTVTSMNSFTFGAGVDVPTGGFHFGADCSASHPSTTATAGSDTDAGVMVVPPRSVLVHLVRHLGRTDNALSQSDICRSLLGVVDMGVLHAEVCVACGLDAVIERLLQSNAYELKIDAGKSIIT